MLAAIRNSAKTYLIDGRAPRAGEVFRNPDLAASLRLIAETGRDGYYKGRHARKRFSQISRENGGTMTAADLAEFQPEWVTPIETTYRGWTVCELPPNGQGIAALMMLNLMEQFPIGELRVPQRAGAARDDRSEEARLRRHAALRRRSEVLRRAGLRHARARRTPRRARS